MGGSGRTIFSDLRCGVALFSRSIETVAQCRWEGPLRELYDEDRTEHAFALPPEILLLPASSSSGKVTRLVFVDPTERRTGNRRGSIVSRATYKAIVRTGTRIAMEVEKVSEGT